MQRVVAIVVLSLLFIVVTGSALADVGAADAPSATQETAPVGPAVYTTTYYVWEPLAIPTGVDTNTISNLAVNPVDAYTVFMGSWDGLYKSTNAGQSWTRVATATLSYVSDVAFAPSNAQRLYLTSWSPYRSDDGGNTWMPLPSPPSACGITVAPSDANRVYVRACNYGDNSPALFRSDNAGQTWITPTVAFTQSLDMLVVAPTQSNVLVGASFTEVFRSTNSGANWTTASVGTHYAGRLVFDPQSPYTLYLGHWQGLLRSTDSGQTWQDSGTGREAIALIASPLAAGEVMGGAYAEAWRIRSSGSTWNAQAWNAPAPLQTLWRSAQDGRVIYARNSAGWWRYVPKTLTASFVIYLPIVQQAAGAFPAGAQQALDRLNVYRARVGVIPLRLHPAIVSATQNHADYFMTNVNDSSAWTFGPHGEVDGKPRFTGRWPSDRILAMGFQWWGGSEVMHFIGEPVASVDGWMATIYHRVIPLDPGAHYTGYGYGRTSQTAVDVMDFGTGPVDAGLWSGAQPYPLAYPAHNQTGVPTTWNGGESPDPLPPGAPRPVGYPFTLQGVGGTLQVTSAQMRNSNNVNVPIHPNPSDCSTFNCFALIPVSPLQPNMTYTVQASGSVGGVAFNQTWTFTTGSSTTALIVSEPPTPPGPPVFVPMPETTPYPVR